MYYRLRFKPAPGEVLFELLQITPITVQDIIGIIKFNFKIVNSKVYENGREMIKTEFVESGRIYNVRIPVKKKVHFAS